MAKVKDLSVGDYIRHPRKRRRLRSGKGGAVLKLDKFETNMVALFRNPDDAGDFMFIKGDTEVEKITR